MSREEYIQAIRSEINACMTDSARATLFTLLGKVLGHDQPKPPARAKPMPKDRKKFLEARLSDVRRKMAVASPIAYTKLLAVEREILDEIDGFQSEGTPSKEEDVAAIRTDLEASPDDLLLIAVDVARKRGLIR